MRRALVLFVILILCLAGAAPAAAAPPMSVTIEATMLFTGAPSTFIAFGPAVDAGIVCPAGEVLERRGIAAGPPWFSRQVFHVWHEFECADGSGSFVLNLAARVIFEPEYSNNGNWNVLWGTGDYVTLKGAGSQVGSPLADGVFDIYTGWVLVP